MPITASLGALTSLKGAQTQYQASGYWKPTSFPGVAPLYQVGGGTTPNTKLVNWQNSTGFTLEYWVYIPNLTTGGPFISSSIYNSTIYWTFSVTSTGALQFLFRGTINGYLITQPGLITTNNWVNVCLVCTTSGGTTNVKMFINGTQRNIRLNNAGSYVSSYNLTMTANLDPQCYILAGTNSAGQNVTGNMDELRISSINRYSSSYTPQTTQFTSDSNTELLIHFNYDIEDNPVAPTFPDSSGHNYVYFNYAPYVTADTSRYKS